MDSNNSTLTIVMADDDADDHFFFREALNQTRVRCNFFSVFNGVELLDLLLHRGKFADHEVISPSCIILDMNMPVLDGLEALAQIKKHEKLRNIPVYVFSTSRSPEDIKKVNDLGASKFYTKPPHYDKLKEVIEEIISDL